MKRVFVGTALACLVGSAAAAAPPLATDERAAIVGVVGDRARNMDDDALLAATADYARRELGQRITPDQVDPRWAISPARRDVDAELQSARSRGALREWLGGLSPASASYLALNAARARYGRIAAAGGWAKLEAGPALRQGDRGPAVRRLRERLHGEGFVSVAPSEDFDAELETGLRRFQATHGLEPDGILGRETRAALNVSAAARLAQIEANLERWRWLPHQLPNDRLEVDVGGAQVALVRDGRIVLSMRAIVGDPAHPTPMFASRIEAVVFNPPWNVPSSIATAEILPRLATDPGYLARNGFTYANGRLVQKPGPQNALGVLKFDLPSPFGVYLHDTPARGAFARRTRTLSHGCIRLEKPRELAAALLPTTGVDATIASGRTLRTPLARPLPMYVLYWTVVARDGGEVIFRPDPYGWDSKLVAALAKAELSAAAPPTATDCTERKAVTPATSAAPPGL